MHKISDFHTPVFCEKCNKLIMQESYWLIPRDVKTAFSTKISLEEMKMCNQCFTRLSKRKSAEKPIEQFELQL